MILKIFLPKNSAKNLAFFTQNKAKLGKILIITLVFEKTANLFAENCRKSQKIVIITSTPDYHNSPPNPKNAFQGVLKIGPGASGKGWQVTFAARAPPPGTLPSMTKLVATLVS
jgi:hypothetical protein